MYIRVYSLVHGTPGRLIRTLMYTHFPNYLIFILSMSSEMLCIKFRVLLKLDLFYVLLI